MNQGGTSVGGAQPRDGAALVRVEEAGLPGQASESDGHDLFEYLGDGFEEDNNAEACRRVIRGFAWLVQNHPIRMLKTGRVVPQGDKGGEEVEEYGRIYGVHPLPDPVGYTIWAGGRGGRAPAEGQFYLFLRERSCAGVGGEPSPRRGRRLWREEVLEKCVIFCCRGVGPRE